MKAILSLAAELGGLGLMALGAALVAPWLGLLAAGLALLWLAYRLDEGGPRLARSRRRETGDLR